MCHPVERRTSYKHLRRLPLKLSRTYSLPEYRFDPKHLCLGQTPSVIPTLPLPLPAPYFSYSPQVLIPDTPLSFAVAVPPNLGITSRRDGCTCPPLSYRLVTIALIIRAIAADLLDLALDLLKQVFDKLAVGQVVCGSYSSSNFTSRTICADVQLAPSPVLGEAVLTDFPFALAEDFDAGRVYDHMHWPVLFSARQDHLKRLSAAAQARVVRHAQSEAERTDDRQHQPLSRAKGQMIDLLQSGHTEDGGVRVVARFASLAAFLVVTPRMNDVITDPESKTTALNKSVVILFPIAETVGSFGFFVLHKSRIPVLSSPCFMQQSHF